METYEKLGAFYLGKPQTEEGESAESGYLLYDSKDLTTHAVCVGMTGSGKTGLCVGLLEEAAIDGIPAIVIDPKGDLGNLLLTFPELDPASFRPWINEEDARKEGVSPDEYAAQQAELWRTGLGKWGQSAERIQRLKDAADFTIYTPGSRAGVPISILSSFAAPPAAVLEDTDLYRDRVSTAATSLLTLLGIDADPIQSREHILLSTILDHAWRQGQSLDLGDLIQAIQEPPVERVGVVDIETFYPAKKRFELAMRLNGLLAAPGFQGWLEGEPLDVGRFLATPEGKPRIAIISIAHLSDSERMFFVSLLLNEVLSWIRSRPGTSSLRALLYMDEIFGYMPPVAEPPSKKPLLTLLKQARAYGLGVVLATQNPVDLDYKGLSNTGTWFLGRLQTERDKMRVLDGLEGAGGVDGFDRQKAEAILSGLGKRTFWLHNVHDSEPVIFRTRWVMSYLRGPLTRDQIARLMDGRKQEADFADPESSALPPSTPSATDSDGERPVTPPDTPEVFLPVRHYAGELRYAPAVIGLGKVHFTNRQRTREATESICLLQWLDGEGGWSGGEELDVDGGSLSEDPPGPALFDPLPSKVANPKSLAKRSKALSEWLYRERRYELLRSPSLDEVSHPGESEGEFRIRLRERAREERDEQVAALRKKYASRLRTLRDRIQRAEQKVEREREQVSSKRIDTAISLGSTILSAFLGRKRLSSTTLSKAGTTARTFGRSGKEAEDVRRAEESLETLEEQLRDLEADLEREIDEMGERYEPMNEELESVALRPRRTDVQVDRVALAWVPYTRPTPSEHRWLYKT